MAVSHGFGGAESQQKADWMSFAVDQWFSENANIEIYELEDFLTDVMNTEFDTLIDDGSLREISQMICGCYKLCQQGDETTLREKLEKLPQPALQNCVRQPEQDQGSDDEEEMTSGPGQPQERMQASRSQGLQSQHNTENTDETMETESMEDDGWQTVSKKGKRR